MQTPYHHITVLKHELVDVLDLKPGHTAVDCTLGGGGHTKLMLEKVGPSGKVIAFDRDLAAIQHAQRLLKPYIDSGNLVLHHAPFSEFRENLGELYGKVHGLCADLGVSSPQIDEPGRGFSFMHDGPLDMRMDTSCGQTAADVVNQASAKELQTIFFKFGEEPKSAHLAKCIVEHRTNKPFLTTQDLAQFIKSKLRYNEASRKHPATKVFQALRIYVNGELDELVTLLADLPDALVKGGRASFITFHSLEDRLVKLKFNELQGKTAANQALKGLPLTETQLEKAINRKFEVLTQQPQLPSEEEVIENPRARSAKLRAILKTAN
jgi:16S rRNA (cytosine1402-N4)-methyltransferase